MLPLTFRVERETNRQEGDEEGVFSSRGEGVDLVSVPGIYVIPDSCQVLAIFVVILVVLVE